MEQRSPGRGGSAQIGPVGPIDVDALVDASLATALDRLDAQLRDLGSVLVAFSGGADSAFLLAAAVRALGPDAVVAATAVSPSLASSELDAARAFCAELGVRHVAPTTHEMDREGYQRNAGDRCYFCKSELLDVLGPIGDELGLAAVATGTNADDAAAGFRPGIRAARERGAVTPLLDAALTKAQIRVASRTWGLSTWDKPAAACLSSRVAFGVRVTPWRLARVDRAETALRATLRATLCDTRDGGGTVVGARDLRVRDLGDRVRVELDTTALAALGDGGVASPLRAAVLDAVRRAGFDVAVDVQPFRSGSMNELLPDPERFR